MFKEQKTFLKKYSFHETLLLTLLGSLIDKAMDAIIVILFCTYYNNDDDDDKRVLNF